MIHLAEDVRFIPMLYSTPMVQAINANRKTKTRRLVKPQPILHKPILPMPVTEYVSFLKSQQKKGFKNLITKGSYSGYITPDCPYGKPGDIIWVRETWQYIDFAGEDNGYVYRATDPDWETMEGWKWKPNIFMPKEAARIYLRITDIGVERLWDISEEDAIAEGIEPLSKFGSEVNTWKDYLQPGGTASPTYSFQTLWQSINGLDSWNENPYVWVITFEQIEKP